MDTSGLAEAELVVAPSLPSKMAIVALAAVVVAAVAVLAVPLSFFVAFTV